MCPQGQRFRVLRAELTDQPGPDRPRGAHFRDLHEEVHPDRPEEAEPRGERIDVQPGRRTGPQVLQTVGQRVGELQVGGGPGLLDVVAGDRDRVEFRHFRRGEGEDVGDDPHRRRRRVDVGVADHELFEDVVLDGAGQFLRRHPLFLGRHDVQRQHRQHGAVHRHRHTDGVQRDVLEQLPHVVDRIDRDPGHPDIPGHPRVVGVVPAVGRQVERDRQALLPGGEIAPVEGVRFLRGGEARVLPDRPRLGGVHRRIRPAQERRQARDRCPARPARRDRPRCRPVAPQCLPATTRLSHRITVSGDLVGCGCRRRRCRRRRGSALVSGRSRETCRHAHWFAPVSVRSAAVRLGLRQVLPGSPQELDDVVTGRDVIVDQVRPIRPWVGPPAAPGRRRRPAAPRSPRHRTRHRPGPSPARQTTGAAGVAEGGSARRRPRRSRPRSRCRYRRRRTGWRRNRPAPRGRHTLPSVARKTGVAAGSSRSTSKGAAQTHGQPPASAAETPGGQHLSQVREFADPGDRLAVGW